MKVVLLSLQLDHICSLKKIQGIPCVGLQNSNDTERHRKKREGFSTLDNHCEQRQSVLTIFFFLRKCFKEMSHYRFACSFFNQYILELFLYVLAHVDVLYYFRWTHNHHDD